ncbi:MAG: ferritin-like domain-containing protein [Fibrobacteres bacterium]|nr:ferritin-like domain-containing protein [Fibrobacterota bacterium]
MAKDFAKDKENQIWLLSFYRVSEITGALFFGRLAKSMKPGSIQMDLTRHFADEAEHARLWTDCLAKLGAVPLKLEETYQERYLAAAGMPANLMEVLALTQIFERRVINQYSRHARLPGLDAPVRETLALIMEDEKWHLQWIREALRGMEDEYGADAIASTLRRYSAADQEAYADVLSKHGDKLDVLLGGNDADIESGEDGKIGED